MDGIPVIPIPDIDISALESIRTHDSTSYLSMVKHGKAKNQPGTLSLSDLNSS